MLTLKRQAGFTLVEVTMTLAITGVLILIVFIGQAEIRRRAQFSDSMERIKNSLNTARSESLTTVNCKLGVACDQNNGANHNQQVLGRELIFDTTKDYVQVYSLVAPTSGSGNYTQADGYRIDYAWGSRFRDSVLSGTTSTNPAIVVFWRRPADGSFVASGFICADSVCTTDPANNAASYTGTTGNFVLNFVSPYTHNGSATVELPGGSITRVIQ